MVLGRLCHMKFTFYHFFMAVLSFRKTRIIQLEFQMKKIIHRKSVVVDKWCLREVLCSAVHFTPTESLHRGGRVGKRRGGGGSLVVIEGVGGPHGVKERGGGSYHKSQLRCMI